MGIYSKYLYDHIGNKYDRKNMYLRELIDLEEGLKQASREEKGDIEKKIRALKDKKNKHPYIISLNQYLKLEEEFKEKLKKEVSKIEEFKNFKEVNRLKRDLFIAEKKSNFYRDYKDLSYEAEYKYEKANIQKNKIPEMISLLEEKSKEVEGLKEKLDGIEKSLVERGREEFKSYKEEKIRDKKEKIEKLKENKGKKLLSKKAYKKGLERINKIHKEDLRVKKHSIYHREVRENYKSEKYKLKYKLRQLKWVMKSDIEDIRSKIPFESEKKQVVHSYLTIALPGLGQILNRQYIKGLSFFLISIFIYLIAIPYALGYGNYQGQGISGLIGLAEGGRRIDQSIIFLIEGLIAIVLSILSLLLLLISYKDSKGVEKNSIRGIRPNTWFKTKNNLREDGFPYLVSAPALLLVLFAILIPIVTTILLSFTNMNPQNQAKFSWIGIQNYRMIFLGQGLAGQVFWYIFIWTIIWTFVATSLAILIGFSMALLVNNPRIRGKTFFRAVFLLPWAVPAFISVLFFSILLSQTGALTQILGGIFNTRIDVKSSTQLTRLALIMIQGWLGSSYIFLLATGVLQSIPEELYEAAEIDGATRFQMVKKITVPLVLFQTAPLLIGQYTFNFNNFSVIYLFNSGGPFEPTRYGNLAGSSDLLISYIYKLTIDSQYQAIGAAIISLISIGLMFITFLGFKNSKAFKEER